MKKIEIISDRKNYTAANIGSWDRVADYVTPLPSGEFKGKVFAGSSLKMSGTEVSFQWMPPKSEIPFSHSHIQNEELYVFLKGKGEFEVDGERISVKEGTVIRVAPAASRTWRNNSDEPLVLMVIQSKAGALEHFGVSDGKIA